VGRESFADDLSCADGKMISMTKLTEPIPYAEAESRRSWFSRHKTEAATRMVAFALLALAGLGCRYLSTSVIGNSDLHDCGKYMLIGSCIGFAFEYVVSLVG
jgi:hypothetical protein